MTTYYFSMTAGQSDANPQDITIGTVSNAGADIEVRIPVPGGSGATSNRLTLMKMLDNIQRRIEGDATVLPVI